MQSHDFKFTRRGDGKDYAMTSSDNMEQFVLGATRSWSSSFVESSFVESLLGIEREGKPVPAKSYSIKTASLGLLEVPEEAPRTPHYG